MTVDKEILTAALFGYEAELARIEQKIREIRARLGTRSPGRPKTASTAPVKKAAPARAKRQVSAAARKRMAAAQRKRWAAVKSKKSEQ